jgi:hypothetical protein
MCRRHEGSFKRHLLAAFALLIVAGGARGLEIDRGAGFVTALR